jgi:mono/diheme cytochrome c family protein
MMRGSAIGFVVCGAVLAGTAPQAANPQAPAGSAQTASAHQATVNQYCVTCHNQRLKTGDLALDALDPANVAADAETWEKVVRKLRLGVMPPQGVRRPDQAAVDGLIGWLEEKLDSSPAARTNPGRPVLRRLNRAEYSNAIRDLLGMEVDVASFLPPDDSAFGFDNVADAQANSPALLQAYLAAARKISAVAVGDPRIGLGSDTYSVRQDLSQDKHLDGLPLGTIGGLLAKHTFPVDGEYDFQIRLYRTNLSAIRGLQDPHEIELTIDGERILLAKVGGPDDLVPLQQNPTETSDAIEAKRLRLRHFVKAGQRDVAAAVVGEVPPLLATSRLKSFIRDFANPYAAEGATHVQSVTIQGPYNGKASATPPSRQVFLCRPASASEELPCARRITSALAARAYRRPLSSRELDGLLTFYKQERAGGDFVTGIGFVLRRILASPSFVFRPEREPAGLSAGTPYRVADVELASRLSFFLWSSIPDDELMDLARKGTLARPQVLEQQVRRLLADRRSNSFVSNFAGQWLQLRNLRGIIPNSETFPDFDDNLRQAFRREAELFFDSIMREDRSVLDLLDADYTFVNERLARHYGIRGVVGSHFRRVPLTDPVRRGLLGKGAVLMVTSHATTTSPVLRGKWVLENLMGAPPPVPPPDVPAIEEPAPGAAPRTMREQMEKHRANPTCAACHKIMDPIGFALENFDVVGAWRATNEVGVAFNTVDVMADGQRIDGVVTLRQALLKRPDVFVGTLTEKLLVYALGRGLTALDMPVVRQIVRETKGHEYRFSALVQSIVNSVPFQMRLKSSDQDSTHVAAVR